MVNRAMAELYGLPAASLVGRRQAEFHPDAAQAGQWLDDDRRVIDSGQPSAPRTMRLLLPDGGERLIRLERIPLTIPGEPQRSVLCVGTDMTQWVRFSGLERERRNLAAEALLTSEMKYRTLYDSSRDAIMILAPEQGFLSGNPSAIRLFGCATKSNSPLVHRPNCRPNFSRMAHLPIRKPRR
jgi:PAS domain-containing protein